MAAYPLRLRRVGRQQGKCFAPESAGAADVSGCFALFGFGRERVQPLCVDQGVAEERSYIRDGRVEADFL
jgi:hypothetical protein